MGKIKELVAGLEVGLEIFENMGKEILKHKYLYYVKSSPEITDYEYDMLERKYTDLAKALKQDGAEEPEVHILQIYLWGEDDLDDWPPNATMIDFPHNHPWAEEIIDMVENGGKTSE